MTNTLEASDESTDSLVGRAAAYNPRKISDSEMESLRRSMRFFGVVEPIIVNKRSGSIVGGHQRVKAAVAEGIESLPVVWVDLDDPAERQLNIALNRIRGEWQDEKLAVVLSGLDDAGADLSLTGFGEAELEALLRPFAADDPLLPKDDDAGGELYGAGTDLARSSAPLRYWQKSGLLQGVDVLDFGCGEEQHGFARYDAFTAPDVEPLLTTYGAVMCNYVLNVQPSDHLITEIAVLIRGLLVPEGVALFAVVTDSKLSDTAACGNRRAKSADEWQRLLEPIFLIQAAKGASFCGLVGYPRPNTARVSNAA